MNSLHGNIKTCKKLFLESEYYWEGYYEYFLNIIKNCTLCGTSYNNVKEKPKIDSYYPRRATLLNSG